YGQLFYQLKDPNGTALSFSTSLLTGSDGQPLAIALTTQQRDDLTAWLFGTGGPPYSIYSYLTDRANFRTSVAAPPAAFNITHDVDRTAVNPREIFELSFAFTFARTGGAVQGDMETTPGIKSIVTDVAPLTGKFAGQGSETRGLTAFAQDFEDALTQSGVCRLKVATGVDRSSVSAASASGTLWAVRLGLTAAQGIWYDITPATSGNPAVFSPRPISNQLQTRKGINIYDYIPGQGLSKTVSRVLDFVGIDMDVWIQQLFTSVDGVLTPEYTAAMEIVGKHFQVGYLNQLLQQ